MNGFSFSSSSRAQVCISIWAQTQGVPTRRVNKDRGPYSKALFSRLTRLQFSSLLEHPAVSTWAGQGLTLNTQYRELPEDFTETFIPLADNHSKRAIISNPPIRPKPFNPESTWITKTGIIILAEKSSNLYWYSKTYFSKQKRLFEAACFAKTQRCSV